MNNEPTNEERKKLMEGLIKEYMDTFVNRLQEIQENKRREKEEKKNK